MGGRPGGVSYSNRRFVLPGCRLVFLTEDLIGQAGGGAAQRSLLDPGSFRTLRCEYVDRTLYHPLICRHRKLSATRSRTARNCNNSRSAEPQVAPSEPFSEKAGVDLLRRSTPVRMRAARSTSSAVAVRRVLARTMSGPTRSCGVAATAAPIIAVRSGSLDLQSGVGTQMVITSAPARELELQLEKK